MATTITPETIEREARYGLTRYTPADADKIRAIANELDILAAVYEELIFSAQVWLAVNAPGTGNIFSIYVPIASAEELLSTIINTCAFDTKTDSGGHEKYPLTTWKKWIGKNKTAIKELQAAYDFARDDMISQAANVNWWAT